LENISFRMEIPDSVTVTNPGELEFSEGILHGQWPSLFGEKSLIYRIELNRAANVTLNANLTGFYESGARLSKSSKLTLKSLPDPNPINLSASFSTQEPTLGDTLTYILTLANGEADVNTVSNLLISVPGSVTLVRWDDRLRRVGSQFSWGGTVPGDGQQQFDISFRPERSGKLNITAQFENTFYNRLQAKYVPGTKTLISRTEVKLKPLAPRITFMLNRKQVNASEPGSIHVFISNPNNKTFLYDIDAVLVTNLLGNYTKRLANLTPEHEIELFYIQFTAPSFTKDTTLKVVFNGTYRTKYYENLSFKTTNTLLIKRDPNATLTPAVKANLTVAQNKTATQQQAGAANQTTPAVKQNASAPLSGNAQPDNFFTKIVNWFRRLFGGK